MDHRIESLADALEVVTPENIDLFLSDLRTWFAVHFITEDSPLTMRPVFYWNDDGEPGLKEIRLTVEGQGRTSLAHMEQLRNTLSKLGERVDVRR